MANKKISALTDGTTANATDRIAVARDPTGTPLSRYITPAYINTYISGVAQTITGGRSFQNNVVVSAGAGGFVVDAGDVLGLGGGDGTCHIHTSSAGIVAAPTDADDLVVESSGNTGICILGGATSTCSLKFGDAGDTGAGSIVYDHNSNVTTFTNAGIEAGRFNPTSFLKVSNGGTYLNSTANYHELRNNNNASGDIAVAISNGGSNTENTSSWMIYGHSGNNYLFAVYGNGNVGNSNNSYGALSDRKFKDAIADSSSQWDDIKNIKIKKYKNKLRGGEWNLGAIADEVKKVSPGLVYETVVDGETVEGINYSILYMKAVKALQEAMERIEALEAKIN